VLDPDNPSVEHGVSPLDPALGLPWPADLEPVLSEKDAAARRSPKPASQGSFPASSSARLGMRHSVSGE
jgi:dTDP-4-dehydrorhamnose 3,5-epimerase